MTRWAEEKYKELVSGLALVRTDAFSARVTGVESYSGDVTVNHRKGKTMVFFELNITLKWEGELAAPAAASVAAPSADGVAAAPMAIDPERASGLIKMPYIAEENGEDGDYDIEVTLEKKKASVTAMHEAVRRAARPVLAASFREFLAAVRAKGGQLAPTKAPADAAAAARSNSSGASGPDAVGPPATSSVSSTLPSGAAAAPARLSITAFEQSVTVELPPDEMFVWFTDPGRVSAFTMSPASVSAVAGSAFSLFGGMVTGEQVEVVPGARLVQRWRFSSWPAGHYSRVELSFAASESGGTTITLAHSDVPKADLERTKAGWNDNYWSRFKNLLGFSVNFIK